MLTTARSRSSRNDRKSTPRVKHGLLGAKLHVTSRKPQQSKKWVQTTVVGYTAVGMPKHLEVRGTTEPKQDMAPADSNRRGMNRLQQCDVADYQLTALRQDVTMRVQTQQERSNCSKREVDKGSQPHCWSCCRSPRRATLWNVPGDAFGIAPAATYWNIQLTTAHDAEGRWVNAGSAHSSSKAARRRQDRGRSRSRGWRAEVRNFSWSSTVAKTSWTMDA
ncbi:hypothetical protein PF011_g11283 [Phytophthora fragariae]|uniref:Uncharacterized protein n=1 Tax=Phytophthora fragariae TaxID=53985 RepID=A0A6A3KMU6_9STRA|nr:hypothetical protein PF011_g11283 [Phytophthora fragariae]